MALLFGKEVLSRERTAAMGGGEQQHLVSVLQFART